jgi:mannose-6-phosphate isomerase
LFTAALTFAQHAVKDALLDRKSTDKSGNNKTQVYAPPISEFNMLVTELGKGEEETVKAVAGPCIMFVTSGTGTMVVDSKEFLLQEGYIFFIGQGVEVGFKMDRGMVAYRAYAE